MFRQFLDFADRKEVFMRIKLTKSYPQKVVFKNLELEFKDGEIICILGGSGVGKTTLLNALARLIDFDGTLEGVPEKVSYVFQTPRLLPHLTVKENLLYAFEERVSEEAIQTMLEKSFLLECKDRKAKLLSGGDRKRVSLARAFLSDASLLLMDEPFNSVDTALKLRLIDLFAKLWKEEQKTVVFVTHDIEEALMLADKIVVLKQGGEVKEFSVVRDEFPSKYGDKNELRTELVSELLKDESIENQGVKLCED